MRRREQRTEGEEKEIRERRKEEGKSLVPSDFKIHLGKLTRSQGPEVNLWARGFPPCRVLSLEGSAREHRVVESACFPSVELGKSDRFLSFSLFFVPSWQFFWGC